MQNVELVQIALFLIGFAAFFLLALLKLRIEKADRRKRRALPAPLLSDRADEWI